jgi:uncharacterized repeat protein (TIGR03803 family)
MRRTCYLLSLLLLIGCSQAGKSSLPAVNQSGPSQATTSSQFKVIYGFDKAADGYIPVGTLLSLNGVLYGTTNFGGHKNSICYPGNGCGVVFALNATTGGESAFYDFSGVTTGARSYAGLIAMNNTMYGTTQLGGKYNKGVVFSLTTSGTEAVLHAFKGKDGEDSRAGLVADNGVFYGTTYYGGSSRTGTVFSITPSGTEKVMHSFTGGTDGALPLSQLVAVHASPTELYGTTSTGGTYNAGTVFEIAEAGSFYSVIHSFTGGKTDGASPFAGLVEANGTLYGTTELGGRYNKGTVFSISYGGTETVLHSFGKGKDGAKPYSGLTVLNGALYGTTAYGGTAKEGTIFEITPTGTETVLHSFSGGKGGRVPYANLTAVNNTLYGVTIWGGPRNVGTAYELTP